MIDAQHPLRAVLASLCVPERGDGRAPVIALTASDTGVGTSYVSRILGNYGSIEGPYDATFGQAPFWQVSPDGVDEQGRRKSARLYGGLNLIGSTGLAVTEFHWSDIKSGQTVHVRAAREYWHTLRDHFALIIVDTPAFDRADTALTVVSEADKTVLVCAPDTAHRPSQKALSDRIQAAEGRCAGLIVNEGAANAQSQLA